MNLRRVVAVVALLNLAYFGVEFAVARAIGSVSLFADSVDFLEDASLNILIALALEHFSYRYTLLSLCLNHARAFSGVISASRSAMT